MQSAVWVNGIRAMPVQLADSLVRRFLGLLGQRVPPATALLLRPCSSVHTWFMRFPIDVVYLDRWGTVVKVVPKLPAWRFSFGGKGAHAALEMAPGAAARLGIRPGQTVRLSVED
jgi:uncharacterized membrane protein (UPF0127 family)